MAFRWRSNPSNISHSSSDLVVPQAISEEIYLLCTNIFQSSIPIHVKGASWPSAADSADKRIL